MQKRPTGAALALCSLLSSCSLLRPAQEPPHYPASRSQLGVIVQDLVVPVDGAGFPDPTIALGDTIVMDYAIWDEGGELLDSSYRRGVPLTLRLGSDQVIPGLTDGLLGMRPGGRRVLVIPPELGYVPGLEPSSAARPEGWLILDIEVRTRAAAPASP